MSRDIGNINCVTGPAFRRSDYDALFDSALDQLRDERRYAVRSYAPGFIFTTALPPPICAAATAAIQHLKTSQHERDRHQDRAARLKSVLYTAGLPVMPSETHVVPVHVGDPEKCKLVSNLLLWKHGIT